MRVCLLSTEIRVSPDWSNQLRISTPNWPVPGFVGPDDWPSQNFLCDSNIRNFLCDSKISILLGNIYFLILTLSRTVI